MYEVLRSHVVITSFNKLAEVGIKLSHFIIQVLKKWKKRQVAHTWTRRKSELRLFVWLLSFFLAMKTAGSVCDNFSKVNIVVNLTQYHSHLAIRCIYIYLQSQPFLVLNVFGFEKMEGKSYFAEQYVPNRKL
jgi:hypothetical protein